MDSLDEEPLRIDAVDRELIVALQEDGRASYAKLASRVRLSPAAVRNRVSRLIDSGTIKVLVNADPVKLGYRTAALIGLRCQRSLDAVTQLVEKLDEVNYAVVVAGRFDLVLEVVCTDTDHLLEVTNEFRAIDGVTDVEVTVVLKYLKVEQMSLRGLV
ncbi:MAG: transcriptional regulator, AsnC family [Actinomycetia bacterium]|nr:transcriptional regulator, AsnC family [Actinomycetes bacterium]